MALRPWRTMPGAWVLQISTLGAAVVEGQPSGLWIGLGTSPSST